VTFNVVSSPTAPTPGLRATYFNNADLTGTSVSRVDATVNFDWGTGSPHASIAADTFSARWVGKVKPQFSQTYTFYTQSNDGVRLWVNNQLIINNWTQHALTENRASILLQAGVKYDIRLEFFEGTGSAAMKLLWSSASTPKAVVPSSALSTA
jgi:hypothetical protein